MLNAEEISGPGVVEKKLTNRDRRIIWIH